MKIWVSTVKDFLLLKPMAQVTLTVILLFTEQFYPVYITTHFFLSCTGIQGSSWKCGVWQWMSECVNFLFIYSTRYSPNPSVRFSNGQCVNIVWSIVIFTFFMAVDWFNINFMFLLVTLDKLRLWFYSISQYCVNPWLCRASILIGAYLTHGQN
jgi:hypothetical protein